MTPSTTPSVPIPSIFTLQKTTCDKIDKYFKGAHAAKKAEAIKPIISKIVKRILDELAKTSSAKIEEIELSGSESKDGGFIPSVDFSRGCKWVLEDLQDRGINVTGLEEWLQEGPSITTRMKHVYKIQKVL